MEGHARLLTYRQRSVNAGFIALLRYGGPTVNAEWVSSPTAIIKVRSRGRTVKPFPGGPF